MVEKSMLGFVGARLGDGGSMRGWSGLYIVVGAV